MEQKEDFLNNYLISKTHLALRRISGKIELLGLRMFDFFELILFAIFQRKSFLEFSFSHLSRECFLFMFTAQFQIMFNPCVHIQGRKAQIFLPALAGKGFPSKWLRGFIDRRLCPFLSSCEGGLRFLWKLCDVHFPKILQENQMYHRINLQCQQKGPFQNRDQQIVKLKSKTAKLFHHTKTENKKKYNKNSQIAIC